MWRLSGEITGDKTGASRATSGILWQIPLHPRDDIRDDTMRPPHLSLSAEAHRPAVRWSRWFAPVLLAGLALAFLYSTQAMAQVDVADEDVIVFYGDSITQGGQYVDLVEAWLLASRPDWKGRVYNRGISSETLSGLTEGDHNPPRPCALDRFSRDLPPLKPTILVSCFGMNDGIYHPFEWNRFFAYRDGVLDMLDRGFNEAKARDIVILTPPPFDPYQRKASDLQAKNYGYRFPYLNYDDTLGAYSEWLLTLAERDHVHVGDLHSNMNEWLARRREEDVSFHLAPDAVHPNTTGHWLMALTAASMLNLYEPVAERQFIEGTKADTFAVKIDEFVPWFVPAVDEKLLEWHRLEERIVSPIWRADLSALDAQPDERPVRLVADADEIRLTTLGELREGILLSPTDVPALKARAEKLHQAVAARRQVEYQAWRRSFAPKKEGAPKPEETAEAVEARIAELTKSIEELRQPVTVEWVIELR
jgi:lysophospholipase L1-like esterase